MHNQALRALKTEFPQSSLRYAYLWSDLQWLCHRIAQLNLLLVGTDILFLLYYLLSG